MYGRVPGHNAVVTEPRNSPPASSWSFGVPGAVANPAAIPSAAVPAWRDLVGFPIGVSVAAGTVYAPNDNGTVYALSATTGRQRWAFQAHNEVMSTPLVVEAGGRRLVVVGAGNSDFSYSQAVRFGAPGAQVVRGTGISAVDAVNALTGKLVWTFPTKGEDMPTPVAVGGRLIFADGGGHVVALDPATGKQLWRTSIGSFVSMSSLDVSGSTVVFGGTHPSRFYGIDAATGKELWAVEPPSVFSSSMGDGTPAVAGTTAVLQIETVSKMPGLAGSEELAIDTVNHRLLWSAALGTGKVPPRNKDASPIVVGSSVYTASPVTGDAYCIDLATGAVKWRTPVPGRVKAPPVLVGGRLLFPTASGTVVAVDAADGAVVHVWTGTHGGFGPQGITVVGETAFVGTNLGWMQAIPLRLLTGRP